MKKDIEKQCNKSWHVFNDGQEKPCQCGKIESFHEYIYKLTKKQNDT